MQIDYLQSERIRFSPQLPYSTASSFPATKTERPACPDLNKHSPNIKEAELPSLICGLVKKEFAPWENEDELRIS